MCLRVPHLYDMHSSLPQQLSNFAFSRSRDHQARVPRDRALHDPPLARRHRHLSVARGDGEGDRARRADRAHRERAGIGGGRGDAGGGGGRAPIAEPRRHDADRAVHRHVRGVPGARPAVRRDGDRAAHRPDARLVLAGGRADQVAKARGQARGGGNRGRDPVCRRASGGGDSGVSARRRPARVAALARHQHAAEDLSVPALGQGDRGDPAADAHAGARATTRRFSPA